MNSVQLIGRLTKDPDTRYTQTGDCVVTFTLAVDRQLNREKREQAEKTGRQTADFIRCQAFGKRAETIDRYLFKGNRVGVNGHIQTGSYDDRNGRKVYTTDVIVEHFDFLESAQNSQNQGGYQNQQNYQKPQQNYQQQGNYQQPPQQQNYQQMNMNDEIPSGYMEIDESDIPW